MHYKSVHDTQSPFPRLTFETREVYVISILKNLLNFRNFRLRLLSSSFSTNFNIQNTRNLRGLLNFHHEFPKIAATTPIPISKFPKFSLDFLNYPPKNVTTTFLLVSKFPRNLLKCFAISTQELSNHPF